MKDAPSSSINGDPKTRPSMCRDGSVMRYVSFLVGSGLGIVRSAWPICFMLMVLEKVAFWAL